MDPKPLTGHPKPGRRRFTIACRFIGSVLVTAPLAYFGFVTAGSAYEFLALVLMAPLAGFVLIVNSLYGLFRYRRREPWWIGIAFLLVGIVGFFEAWYFLPQFKM